MSKTAAPATVATTRRNIFIVEDHPAFREGLVQILNVENDLVVCGQSDTAEQALPAINRLKPDLVLVDITLPGKSGLKLIRELRAANTRVKLLVLSMHDEALYAERVLRTGGDGYIMKQADPEEIVHAVRDVLSGHLYVSEEVLASRSGVAPAPRANGKAHSLDQLTDEELEILESLGLGRSNGEIARKLRLSAKKVETACARIKRKLKLKTVNALIRYAVCWIESTKG
jgi:DNA-binding NarL/FixJ family response regulator